MERFSYLFLFVCVAIIAGAQTKCVFYFIDDGIGVSQVNSTEMYRAEIQKGHIGVKPLLFTRFPVETVATTFSAISSVTGSSAAGTALSTSGETYNDAVGIDDRKSPLQTATEKARKAGKKVGITTSVSVDHTTPVAFYAHQPDRNMYYEITTNLPEAGFDFYAGADFLRPVTTYGKKEAPGTFPMLEEAGYAITRGYSDYRAKAAAAGKMVLIQEEGADTSSSPYAIDNKEGSLTLTQITGSAVDSLTRGEDKNFLLAVEGGKINWICHGNDTATVFHEVTDTDNAIKVARELYKKHPKETLIVVTVGHGTGGVASGTGRYTLSLRTFENQKTSAEELSKKVSDLRKARNNHAVWRNTKDLLPEQMSL